MKRRNKCMVGVGIAVIVIGAVLIYWNVPYSPFHVKFEKQMQARLLDIPDLKEVCTSEEIANLPEPLQKYCSYIGLENSRKVQAVRTMFLDTDFVMDSNTGKKIKMDYELWLFYDKPYRSAYCSSSMMGVPFQGQDYCTEDKKGGMKGTLAKAVQIFDVCDAQGYKACLISWLAESAAINPSALLSHYITYETIDALHVKATVSFEGVTGTGIFTFNEEGAILAFDSDERQVEKVNGIDTAIGWHCDYLDYRLYGTMQRPSHIQCVKNFADRDVVYFDSDQFSIYFLK